MDLLELLKAAVYGVVEGITEWLPVSSTGHMLLVQQFMPLSVSKDFWDMFLVVIQLGAIIAVLVAFFHELNPFSRTKSAGERRSTWTLWAKTIVACVPAAVVGLPLDDWIEDHLGSPFVIAAALIVYGIAFIVIETLRERRAKRLMASATAGQTSASYRPRHFAAAAPQPQQELTVSQVADADARVQDIDDLDWRTALPWASASSRCSPSSRAPRAPAPPSSAASSWAARAPLSRSSRSTWQSPSWWAPRACAS